MTDNRISLSLPRRHAAPALLLLGALTVGAIGCGQPADPPTERSPGERPSAPRNAPADEPGPALPPSVPTDSGCRVTPLGELPSTERAQRLTLLPSLPRLPRLPRLPSAREPRSASDGLTLLVEAAVPELVRLTPAFAVRTRRALPTRFEAAVSVDGGVVALARGPANGAGVAHYHAFQLGEGATHDTELPLTVPVRHGGGMRRNSAGEQVVFTWTDGRQPPVALRFFARGGAPLRFDAAYPLAPEIDLEEARAVQLLRVALDERSFAAIVRVGSAEGIDSQVWLARPTGRVPVHALEDIADIESMAIVGDQVWVIATFEFSRPLLLRIAPDGELAEDPVALARDATLPAQLAGGDPARLLVEEERLLLRRRNPMGDPLLPDALVATRTDDTLPADVLRDAQRYVVVYQDRDMRTDSWPIRFASLDCAPR